MPPPIQSEEFDTLNEKMDLILSNLWELSEKVDHLTDIVIEYNEEEIEESVDLNNE